jgi:hypothetical protein
MATSSILGGDHAPTWPRGSDVASLGPSDSTDSGSDTRGAFDFDELSSDTDSQGTGERSSVDPLNVPSDADILPDHVEGLPAVDIEIAMEAADEDEATLIEDIDSAEIGTLTVKDEVTGLSSEEEEPPA